MRHNREVVTREYSLERYADRLLECYRHTEKAAEKPGHVSARALHDYFLKPAFFSLLRT